MTYGQQLYAHRGNYCCDLSYPTRCLAGSGHDFVETAFSYSLPDRQT